MNDDRAVNQFLREIKRSQQRALETPQVSYMGQVIGAFLGLPELRAFWPVSSVDESGNPRDLSGQSRTLTNNGGTPRGILTSGTPYATFNGTTRYFSRGTEAGLEITGPLTMGGWYNFDAVVSGSYGSVAGKIGGAATNRSFGLSAFDTNGMIVAGVSANGTSDAGTGRIGGCVAGSWHFLGLRYNPSVSVTAFVDNTRASNTTGAAPAALFNGAAAFTLGLHSGAAGQAGKGVLWFLCAAALPDILMTSLYQSSRILFGV
jgi:hypothetical protein